MIDLSEGKAHDRFMNSIAVIPPELRTDAREWCADVFEDMPRNASNADIARCIARTYEGGIAAFVHDSPPIEAS